MSNDDKAVPVPEAGQDGDRGPVPLVSGTYTITVKDDKWRIVRLTVYPKGLIITTLDHGFTKPEVNTVFLYDNELDRIIEAKKGEPDA